MNRSKNCHLNSRRIFIRDASAASLLGIGGAGHLLGAVLPASGQNTLLWPDELPPVNGDLTIPAQEWQSKPGPRSVEIRIHYPGGKLENVTAETGIMLTLHNWGGTFCAGTANPDQLANRLNVVAICVNYLQSGRKASVEDPEPYDFGYLQGLDALRALWFVFDRLEKAETPFAKGRIFATGGSGGGNVTLMVNKLAPRTFTCIIDMCGMAKLSDDIAFNEPGGTGLNARWSRDSSSPNYLRPGRQELHFVGNPDHLKAMRDLETSARIIVVHGADDHTCPIEDARAMVANFQAAKLDVRPHFVSKEDLDGKIFTSSGHALGNRTEIVFKVAGQWLDPKSPDAIRRTGPADFERRDKKVRYPVTGGTFVISYEKGYPVGSFLSNNKSPLADLSPVRIANPIGGHIHPAFCVSPKGTLVVTYGHINHRDLRITRSIDSGQTWTEPEPFVHTIKKSYYPGSLTALSDGRLLHAWNRWDTPVTEKEPRSVLYSLSEDEGKTWNAPKPFPRDPKVKSIIRHPVAELDDGRWLVPLIDRTFLFDPKTETATDFGEGQVQGLIPIVRTPRGTFISGGGLRSTDSGKTWSKIDDFPNILEQWWRHELICLSNGWLLASEILGPGTGGESIRYRISHDDGLTWNNHFEFHNPGRPIGGRACPRTVELDPQTIGVVFYDISKEQEGGPGLFFLRIPIASLGP